jgi:hypothetical protein
MGMILAHIYGASSKKIKDMLVQSVNDPNLTFKQFWNIMTNYCPGDIPLGYAKAACAAHLRALRLFIVLDEFRIDICQEGQLRNMLATFAVDETYKNAWAHPDILQVLELVVDDLPSTGISFSYSIEDLQPLCRIYSPTHRSFTA